LLQDGAGEEHGIIELHLDSEGDARRPDFLWIGDGDHDGDHDHDHNGDHDHDHDGDGDHARGRVIIQHGGHGEDLPDFVYDLLEEHGIGEHDAADGRLHRVHVGGGDDDGRTIRVHVDTEVEAGAEGLHRTGDHDHGDGQAHGRIVIKRLGEGQESVEEYEFDAGRGELPGLLRRVLESHGGGELHRHDRGADVEHEVRRIRRIRPEEGHAAPQRMERHDEDAHPSREPRLFRLRLDGGSMMEGLERGLLGEFLLDGQGPDRQREGADRPRRHGREGGRGDGRSSRAQDRGPEVERLHEHIRELEQRIGRLERVIERLERRRR